MSIAAVNPTTGEVIREYREMAPPEVGGALAEARETFATWSRTSFEARGVLTREAARLLRERADDLARLMALEMGKPIRDGRAEAEKCAWVCEHYAEQAAGYLCSEPVETGARASYVAYRPLGPVLAVMPWNFPLWQVFRFAAPALMAGNVGLLKHASNVPGCALAIEEIFRDAGFPRGAFRTLLIGGSRVAEIIADPAVVAVTRTGSTPAGRSVARAAGECLKMTVLELGGSDPYVVLADADIARAARVCARARLTNSGQSCIAAKRFIVEEGVYDSFLEAFLAEMRAAKVGDPLLAETEVGPLARHDLREELHEQVRASVAAGARRLLGGEIPDGPGAFYPPTVLTEVSPGMPAYEDELFGPVAAVIRARDEADAIHIANDTCFGLGAAVFTSDTARGQRIAEEELEAGCCFVNAAVRSDPRLPFGGIKESGYGRELSSFGIREFVNVKTVYVE
jgi:succinate-semialdehyde dehydrogenase / glutarate-semialdehyde dehydrogenase